MSSTPGAAANLPELLMLTLSQRLPVNISYNKWSHLSYEKLCRHDTSHSVLEKLSVGWNQCVFLPRLAKLFAFPLSFQAIALNLMTAD